MSIFGSNILAGASGQRVGYTIERSLRFRSSASAYLNKTLTTPTNNKIWTWSGWVKRGILSSSQALFGAKQGYSATSRSLFKLDNSDNTLAFFIYDDINGYSCLMNTGIPLLRDPSAWYHIVIAYDSTQATASNRVKIYWNNTQYTFSGSPTYPSLNLARDFNASVSHFMGADAYNSASYLDGYLTEVNFIDGQALDPTSFGEYNEDTGVWQPKKYSGSYGTNGFYLNFSDNTSTTTLGYDTSGNGNNWTPNNISLTSGATYDSMTDTPTPYADGGNYAVLNPLISSGTLSNGNLAFTQTNTKTASSIGVTSGKWYSEATLVTTANGFIIVGVAKVSDGTAYNMFTSGVGYYANDGTKYVDGVNTSYGATFTAGDTIGFALDVDGGTVTFYKNNISQGSITLPSSQGWFPCAIQAGSGSTSATWNANFGQRPFAYTPPTGFLPLHTGNLPDSAIVDGSEYFNPVLYTGNGSARTITGVGFQPDLVWAKVRSTAGTHVLTDAVRGGNRQLFSNLTNAEGTATNKITGFASDGFTLGADDGTGTGDVNFNGNTYVAWNWKANGADVSNTDGSITSTVSANPTAGFSIVSFTGNGVANATVGHGLNANLAMVVQKSRTDAGTGWLVWHKELPNAYSSTTGYISLHNSNGASTTTVYFNGSLFSNTVFALQGTNTNTNNNGSAYVTYCFAEVEGYSKFGSYTGNGSSDGVFVYLGFRPAFVMVKRSSTGAGTANWIVIDTARDAYNLAGQSLEPNLSDAEYTPASSGYPVDILSNGFKQRGASVSQNESGSTYIYMAFAENPFKNSLAR